MPRGQRYNEAFAGRASVLLVGVVAISIAIVARLLYLQLVDRDFLAAEGDERILRTVPISAHRGSITDRFGEPLAVSTPKDSIFVNPQVFRPHMDRLGELAQALVLDEAWVARRITSNPEREFVYLKRRLRPDEAARVLALGVPGVDSLREYQRYYPAGEVAGHIVGFTDIDDGGQEGLELAYDYWLKGEPGAKRIMQDQLGRTIEDIARIKQSRPGKDLATSLDLRLQYLAYRELKAAILAHDARAGSAVVLDVHSGEVLAMVNQPAYNPNDRKQLNVARYRNRAVTDIFEPGSSFKPFVLGAALELGAYRPDSIIDTSPGFIQVGNKPIQDSRNFGRIDVTTVLAKSSNVGASKIALALEPRDLWGVLSKLGIGQLTGSGFPGESAGMLNDPQHWRPIGQATLAYGYGLSVTALQLAQAYATIGALGQRRPVSMVALTEPVAGQQTISAATAGQLLTMLERVVSAEGTGQRAAVPGFRVAGKTGTAWKYTVGGYSEDRYLAVFAGLAPASAPRLATVVVIDEPRSGDYYGGEVAAPVFANIMGAGLRLMAVAPDAIERQPGSVLARLGNQQ